MSTFNECFPGMSNSGDACFRFTDKENQENERILFDNWWRELINLYGQKVTYYVNTYNVLSADNIYGEEPTKEFAPPQEIVIAIELTENAITLTKYGFLSDDEITAFIHISAFRETFTDVLSDVWATQYNIVEPKAGDVFSLSEYGNDRPYGRQPKYFEVTEKLDEDIAQINPLAGHYVFLVKAKRFDDSFEPGIPFNSASSGIFGNQQIYESSAAGILTGGVSEITEPKKDNYDEYDINTTSRTTVFDMSAYTNDDVYGDYY